MPIKGVIVAAGYGTRFLPVTKTIPKEMLPLITRPAIDFLIQEFVQSGIEDILVITSRRKTSLERYLDREMELESLWPGDDPRQDLIRVHNANIFFVHQQEMRGTGHALMMAQPFVGQNPFIVAYPDDIVLASKPLAAQMIDVHRACGGSVLACIDKPNCDLSRFGVIDIQGNQAPYPVRRLVEKPPAGQEPSTLVSLGRYLFTCDLFQRLQTGWNRHSSGEFFHVDAINQLAEEGTVFAHPLIGQHLDTGEPIKYLEANLRYGLTLPKSSQAIKALIHKLASELPQNEEQG